MKRVNFLFLTCFASLFFVASAFATDTEPQQLDDSQDSSAPAIQRSSPGGCIPDPIPNFPKKKTTDDFGPGEFYQLDGNIFIFVPTPDNSDDNDANDSISKCDKTGGCIPHIRK